MDSIYTKTLTKEIKKIIKNQNLNCTVEKFKDKVDWNYISSHKKLSESFFEKFQDKVDWCYISRYQKLSEKFIEKFQDKVDWDYISGHQKLSESFVEKFKDKVDLGVISNCQKLSEEFIEKFQDRVDFNWSGISLYQKLSEECIEKLQDKVNWEYISINQKLSEEFIEKFQDKVDWHGISKYQKLSEEFIEKFKDKVLMCDISLYQKLSPQFRKTHNIKIDKNNWLYKPINFKLKYIKENTNYEVIDDKYIIAFKGIRSDNYSVYNFQYKYEVGKTYDAHCDCNSNHENSFGLSAWDLEKARDYCNEKIIKVKIAISDLGCIVQKENKIRCFKFEVLEKVK